ncbi:hypothetical protein C2G38_2229754 [Gigaspora rosea]|uniref:Uncharacterized protein n=1 Tax=Gigaspora rosea TaxID=44941 RepID=A0A397TVB2_9GLOM|nr:hypothetical protein C2G38_2229754 [Gigaspora rosea]
MLTINRSNKSCIFKQWFELCSGRLVALKALIEFKQNITKHSKVYTKKVFPITNVIILLIKDSMDPFISLNLQTLKNKEDKKVLLSKAEFNEDIALFAYTLHEAIIVDIKRQEDELKRKYTSEISEKM